MAIHGDKCQQERNWVLGEFRNGNIPILVATDVAARGLDVDDIKFVVNYDYPSSSENYIHRIGRTGRNSNTGTAYTFFTPKDGRQAGDLVAVLEEAGQTVPPGLKALAGRFPSMSGRSAYRGRFGGGGGYRGRFNGGGGYGGSRNGGFNGGNKGHVRF